MVVDIESIPDLEALAAANGQSVEEARAELGDKFLRQLVFHKIICIGAIVAHRADDGHFVVDELGAPHVGERAVFVVRSLSYRRPS
jgi:hypothetical protein